MMTPLFAHNKPIGTLTLYASQYTWEHPGHGVTRWRESMGIDYVLQEIANFLEVDEICTTSEFAAHHRKPKEAVA
jgi:hypothetical protein